MALTKERLRNRAFGSTMFPLTSLPIALERLGFVQADPIRSPARAQDLILRHRVKSYRAGDLEAVYPNLKLEEDYLYAYGFMSHSVWNALHPRPKGALNPDELRLLDVVSNHKKIHPRELETYFGREREVNAWGSYSKATTRLLQSLHYRGYLRVAGREKGIRLYEPTVRITDDADEATRLSKLVLLIAGILGPLSVTSLRLVLRNLAYASPLLSGRKSAVMTMQATGELESELVDGVQYIWPTAQRFSKQLSDTVRFLAPFDPVVWDRQRFEHLWGWAYRFEAYTPPPKRERGYYALPLAWRDDVIGWVNISYQSKQLDVHPGFVRRKPNDVVFKREYEAEVERFRSFMMKRD